MQQISSFNNNNQPQPFVVDNDDKIQEKEEEPFHDLQASASRSSSHIEGTLDPSLPYDQISLPHELLFIALLCLGQLFTQASTAQTIVPFQYQSETFRTTNPGQISWFSAGFSLTVGTFILIAGRLGDMHGLKTVFLAGFVWYGVWSIVAGLSSYSHSPIFFSTARALQGIGPALVMPNAVGIIGSYYPVGTRRIIAMCAFAAVAPGGFVVGSVFSSLCAQFASWQWGFYCMGIACFLVAFLSYFTIPENIGFEHRNKDQKFDYYGAFTGVCGLFLFNFAWNQGPVVGWDVPYVYVLLIVGVLFLVAFFIVERRVDSPLVPHEVLRGETGAILGCIAAGWSSFGIWVYYTHQFGMEIEHRTPLEMAARFTPMAVFGCVVGACVALLLRAAPSSVIILLSMMAFCGGSIIMGLRPVGQVYWAQMFVSLLVMGYGMEMSFPAGTVILSQSLPKEKQGVAGSIINTVVNYSISIGLGIAGTVDYYTTKKGHTKLETIRYSFYTGMGLAGFGVLLGLYFVYNQLVLPKLKQYIKTGKSSFVVNNQKEPTVDEEQLDSQLEKTKN